MMLSLLLVVAKFASLGLDLGAFLRKGIQGTLQLERYLHEIADFKV